jgi:hypothetical protein
LTYIYFLYLYLYLYIYICCVMRILCLSDALHTCGQVYYSYFQRNSTPINSKINPHDTISPISSLLAANHRSISRQLNALSMSATLPVAKAKNEQRTPHTCTRSGGFSGDDCLKSFLQLRNRLAHAAVSGGGVERLSSCTMSSCSRIAAGIEAPRAWQS